MSAFSDWKCGAMTDDEFDALCTRYNNQQRHDEKMEDLEPKEEEES